MNLHIITAFCTIAILMLSPADILAETTKKETMEVKGHAQTTADDSKKNTVQTAPKAYFPEVVHEFEAVVEGLKVTYDFVVQNNGQSPLKIKRVKTGCGCTVASYSKQIPANGTGKISIKFDTRGYGGKTVRKTITVSTNDPTQPDTDLAIKGKVNLFAKITPRFARLVGRQGENIELDVTIRSQQNYPFKIDKVKAKNNEFITYSLTEPTEKNPRKYILHLKNTKIEAGRYADAISLHTDSKIQPIITIGVYGYIKEKKKAPSSKKTSGQKGAN